LNLHREPSDELPLEDEREEPEEDEKEPELELKEPLDDSLSAADLRDATMADDTVAASELENTSEFDRTDWMLLDKALTSDELWVSEWLSDWRVCWAAGSELLWVSAPLPSELTSDELSDDDEHTAAWDELLDSALRMDEAITEL